MLTGRQDIVCYTPTDGTWNPMTPAVPSALFKTVRFRIWLAAAPVGGEFTFSPGVQRSHRRHTRGLRIVLLLGAESYRLALRW